MVNTTDAQSQEFAADTHLVAAAGESGARVTPAAAKAAAIPHQIQSVKKTEELDQETQLAAKRLDSTRFGYRFCKRAFDVLFSLFVLIVFCWLFAIIALAIKLDNPKGPIAFKQVRVGKNGKLFEMYKFRSMVVDAEAHLDTLLEYNEKSGPVFKLHDDPRVTRVGRFIRKTSLDELPQFINVLKGDLSVVGPRPALPREVVKYSPHERERLMVAQGLTCLWQVQPNRDEISFEEWVNLDLLYIRECSIWLDLKIIGRTILSVLGGRGH